MCACDFIWSVEVSSLLMCMNMAMWLYECGVCGMSEAMKWQCFCYMKIQLLLEFELCAWVFSWVCLVRASDCKCILLIVWRCNSLVPEILCMLILDWFGSYVCLFLSIFVFCMFSFTFIFFFSLLLCIMILAFFRSFSCRVCSLSFSFAFCLLHLSYSSFVIVYHGFGNRQKL